MSKVYRRTIRRDSILQDHVHSIPDGHKTQGALAKPAQSTQSGWHTHLYEHEGLIHETGPAFEGPAHTHETIIGASSGPQMVPPKPIPSGEVVAQRVDGAMRIGNTWVIRNEEGLVVAKGRTSYEAQMRYKKLAG